jgi:probable HAF family extracellular repeat protein
VNNQGVVVGTATLANGTARAFRWQGGTLVDIGAGLPGALESHAEGINDHGQVVGWYLDSTGAAQGFLWKDEVFVAPIGDLGGGQAKAYAINNRGLITGTSRTGAPSNEWHAFLLSGPDPTEDFPDTPSVIIGGPGGVNLPPGPAPIGFPPGTNPANHQICVSVTVDTANVPVLPYFNLVYADVTMSDPSGEFWSANYQLADNTVNHPLPGGGPPSFNTNDHWPVSIDVTATYPEWGVLSWDLVVNTC